MRPCIFVIGTRAQLIKVAPVLQAANRSGLSHVVWLSGQHAESIEDLIDDFAIQSRIIRPPGGSERSTILGLIGWLPASIRACYKYVLERGRSEGRPVVVVHGDTLSTLVSAAAGHLAGAEVVHLESGLTSSKLFDPFPEEIIRRLTFRLADYAVCPNEEATIRMRRYRCREVANTGENTLLDCVRYALDSAEACQDLPTSYFVASIHRFENIYSKERLTRIVDEIIAVSSIATVYFILHPSTARRLSRSGLTTLLESAPGVRLGHRMPYTRFLKMLADARGVFSDGGSNQEELSYLGVPTILFRDRSERPDGLGANVVLRREIGEELQTFVASGAIDHLRKPRRLQETVFPSRKTVEVLGRWLGGSSVVVDR